MLDENEENYYCCEFNNFRKMCSGKKISRSLLHKIMPLVYLHLIKLLMSITLIKGC